MVIGWWEFWLGAFSWGAIGGAFWTAVVIGWLAWLIVVGVVVGGFLDGGVFFSLAWLVRGVGFWWLAG